jgi:hypothetical protein
MAAAKPEVLLSAGHNVVLVLDYGSQYTQLIARRVREIGLLSILLPGDVNMVSPPRAIARRRPSRGAEPPIAPSARRAPPACRTGRPPPPGAQGDSRRPSPARHR